LRPYSYIAVDFLAMALGPKHCDFELRDYKSKKPIGRLAFDVSIK